MIITDDYEIPKTYEQGYKDAIDKVMEYTYSMLSDEKMELQQHLKQLKEQNK